jgi:hypothetical protein
MYMILHWTDSDNFLTHIENDDGSIKLFTLAEADEYACSSPHSEDLRVISIQGANE